MPRLYHYSITLFAFGLLSCAKSDRPSGHGGGPGSNGLDGTFDGVTEYDCDLLGAGSYLDTITVSPLVNIGLLVRGDTFVQRMDTSILMFEHSNSYLVYTRPDNWMNLKFHWLGDDGFGTPGCTYQFEANY